MRWLRLSESEFAALPVAVGSPNDRADEGHACMRLECVNRAQVVVNVAGPEGKSDRRWVELCFDCQRVAPREVLCGRASCRREVGVEGLWCDRCRGLVASAAAVVVFRYEALMSPAELAALGTGGGEHVSGTKSPPLPLNFASYGLADEMVQLWEQALVVLIGAVGPTRGGRLLRNRSAVVRLREAASWVGPRAGELLVSDSGRFLGGEVLRAENAAVRLLGLDDPPVERRHAPCQRCNLRTLVRVPGEDKSRCENCGDEIADEDYRVWSKRWAKFEERLGAYNEQQKEAS